MHRTEIDLPLVVDRAAGNLPRQIVDGVRDLVTSGVLRPGDRLPSSRSAAQRWGVARGTVVSAVEQLTAEGYLTPLAGSGTVVNPDLAQVHPAVGPVTEPPVTHHRPAAPRTADAGTRIDLRPGRPAVDGLVDARWRQAWREATAAVSGAPAPAAGLPGLRTEIAAHLRQMRGLLVDPDAVVVTGGARDALTTVLQVLAARRPGRPLRAAVEDPGYPSLRRVLLRGGAQIVPVAVDDDGLSVEALDALADPPDLVVVTPSHQYPLGASLPVARRLALLERARRLDALVIEDDYDSELRYAGSPLPALAALDRGPDSPDGDRVVTLGSFGKTLTPDLAAGFAVLPRPLQTAVLEVRADLGAAPAPVVQRALAGYLAAGGLRRHTQRMRREYRRRRDLLTGALAGTPGTTVLPMDGGLHAVLRAAPGTPVTREQQVSRQLAAEGVAVGALGDYWAGSRPDDHVGWVIGYAGVPNELLAEGLAVVRAVLAAGLTQQRRGRERGQPPAGLIRSAGSPRRRTSSSATTRFGIHDRNGTGA